MLFRDKSWRNSQYFFLTDWTGGKYTSPGMDGSRSGGLLAATWASMVQLGREGYRKYAQAIFETSAAMQDAVRSHPELRILGAPSFLFSFTNAVVIGVAFFIAFHSDSTVLYQFCVFFNFCIGFDHNQALFAWYAGIGGDHHHLAGNALAGLLENRNFTFGIVEVNEQSARCAGCTAQR